MSVGGRGWALERQQDGCRNVGRAGWEGGRPHMCERETMMSAFPSGLVTWPFPGKQTGNRLHKGSACWGRAGGAGASLPSPFPLCCVLHEPVFLSATRWSLGGTAFLQAQEYDSGRESYLLL